MFIRVNSIENNGSLVIAEVSITNNTSEPITIDNDFEFLQTKEIDYAPMGKKLVRSYNANVSKDTSIRHKGKQCFDDKYTLQPSETITRIVPIEYVGERPKKMLLMFNKRLVH